MTINLFQQKMINKALDRVNDDFLGLLPEDYLEITKEVLSSNNIWHVFDKRYCNSGIEFGPCESDFDGSDHDWYSAFSNAAHFFDLFLSRLETKRIEKGFWEKRNVRARIENGNNGNPFAVYMDLEFYDRAVNFPKESALIVLIREPHGDHKNKIRVSFFGTKASTTFLPGYFFLVSFQREYAEPPEATTLSPRMAICMPLYFSMPGENLAKNSTSFIEITFYYNKAKEDLKLHGDARILSPFRGTVPLVAAGTLRQAANLTEQFSGTAMIIRVV